MSEPTNAELIAETERLVAKLAAGSWSVQHTVNNAGTEWEEPVWDIVHYYDGGDSCREIAEIGAVKCDGTLEIARFIARIRTLGPLLAQRLKEAEAAVINERAAARCE